MKRIFSRRVVQVLKLAAAAAVIVYLIHFVSWAGVVESIRAARPGFAILALALLVANLGLEVWLWHRLSAPTPARPSWSDSFSAVLCGHAAGIITPARSGEIFARAMYGGYADAWQAGALALMHRLLDFHAVVLISGPACVYFLYVANPEPRIVWQSVAVAGILAAVLLTLALIYPAGLQRLGGRAIRKEAWRRRLAFLSSWPATGRAQAVLLATLRYVVYVAQYVLLLYAFGAGRPLAMALLAGAVVFYAKLLVPPITFTDVGIRESVSVYVGGFVGIASATAFNAAFFLFLINLVVPAIFGAPFLLRGNRSAARARSVTPSAETGS